MGGVNKWDEAGDAVRSVIRAYHGSPRPEHFNKFDSGFLGTGQGAETYAHGHYSAQNPAIADDYRRSLSYGKLKSDFLDALPQDADPSEVVESLASFDPRQQRFLQAMDDNDWLGYDYPSQAISAAMKRNGLSGVDATDELVDARKNLGTGYELAIDIPEHALLDWDSPARSQSREMLSAFEDAASRVANPDEHKFFGIGGYKDPQMASQWHNHNLTRGNRSGQDVWQAMVSMHGPRGAADRLFSQGVPGVRYLDSGSRGVSEPQTRNYVVFPGAEDAIRILRKFSWVAPVMAAEAATMGGDSKRP
jgi:hypothetical protein